MSLRIYPLSYHWFVGVRVYVRYRSYDMMITSPMCMKSTQTLRRWTSSANAFENVKPIDSSGNDKNMPRSESCAQNKALDKTNHASVHRSIANAGGWEATVQMEMGNRGKWSEVVTVLH